MGFESPRGCAPSCTHGAPTQPSEQRTGASISVGLHLDKAGHHLHPESRSLHSHKAVYARSRDASVTTPANALVAWENLRGMQMMVNNMFLVFNAVGLSYLTGTVQYCAKVTVH